MDRHKIVRVAAGVPRTKVANSEHNADQIIALMQEAAKQGVEIITTPELSITSYTCADLFLQPLLLERAQMALHDIVRAMRKQPIVGIVGIPLAHQGALYNCAVVFTQGRVLGVVPKIHIPNYREFYEARWFSSGRDVESTQIELCGQEVDFGINLTFMVNGTEFGVEICEDLWVASPPSSALAQSGAKIIFNLSASPESVGKSEYIHSLVSQQSARTLSAYVYCSAGAGESSTDLVFSGNALIAENGAVIAKSKRFQMDSQLIIADIDIERLEHERMQSTTFLCDNNLDEYTVIEMEIPEPLRSTRLMREIPRTPFVPSDNALRNQRCEEIVSIQSAGLAKRLHHTKAQSAVIGVSGGLDSTLALLVTVKAFDMLGLDRKGIIAVTMPGFGTSKRTYNNATDLMVELGTTVREISIHDACMQHFKDIGLSPDDRSAAYENAQARERTQILMNIANMEGGLVIGTGDLSELALGWATYNGDHMSMYGVNCSIPKTLVKYLVGWFADNEPSEKIRTTLLDVIDTPVSPELLPMDKDGNIAHKTEELVGPYELHDFFLYHIVRLGYSPSKTLRFAIQAFEGAYDNKTISHWLKVFVTRFFSQQFKRSAMPDGPKVGSVSLSPRGDWRMPSDASPAMWLRDLEENY